jgi:hypothetical protein
MFIIRQQMERDNKDLNRIVADIPHIYSALQFFMRTILICYVSLPNTWTLRHSEEEISCLYVVILSCILYTTHKHLLSLLCAYTNFTTN